MYGEQWNACGCPDLRRTERALRDALSSERLLNVLRAGLFGDREADRLRLRLELAPHIVRAATHRRAPVFLDTKQSKKNSGWSFFD